MIRNHPTRRLIGLILCAALLFLSLGTAVAQQTYDAGVYVVTVKGHNADMLVEVTVSEQRIEAVVIKEHAETAGIADVPLERLPQQIVEMQTLALDTITGATVTSEAILRAVEDCVVQAKGDVEALKVKTESAEVKTKELVTKRADVVIIGGGGAGVSAAYSAAKEGSTVILIEKTAMLGGNTVLAGGGYNAVDLPREEKNEMTEAQIKSVEKLIASEPKNDKHAELLNALKQQFEEYKASGSTKLFDSIELHALQTWEAGDFIADLDLVIALAKEAPVTLQELEDLGLVWKESTLTYVGALWPRSHEARDYKSGIGFIDTYTKAINENNYPVEILMEVRGESLVMKDDRVVGVLAQGQDGTPYELQAEKGVIIATGGFGANVSMREEFNKQWATLDESIKTSNSPAITGDGILMAREIGANLVDMSLIQLLPTCDPMSGAASGYVGQATALMVNREGKRYVNELERRDVLVRAALSQPGSMFYLITNETNTYLDANGVNKFGQPLTELLGSGKVIKGETIAELAEKLGMNGAILQDTIDKFNQASETLNDPEFGRNAFADNILLTAGGPYYATPRQPAVHHTMGGIQIDEKTHVLREDGSIIKGLYAAGETTGGIHGGNRIGANAVPDALAFGRIAGLEAAKGE